MQTGSLLRSVPGDKEEAMRYMLLTRFFARLSMFGTLGAVVVSLAIGLL